MSQMQPAQRPHIFTGARPIDTDKPCCLAYFRALVRSSFRTLCSAAMLDTHSWKRAADLRVDIGGLQAPHEGEGARSSTMASFSHRPLCWASTGSGRGGDLCLSRTGISAMRRDGFQKPFDLPLLVPRHANGKGDLRVTLGEGAG